MAVSEHFSAVVEVEEGGGGRGRLYGTRGKSGWRNFFSLFHQVALPPGSSED